MSSPRSSRGSRASAPSASLLLLVAERSDGLPLVVEELLAARRELPSASLTGSFDELVIARLGRPLAGMPARAPAPGAGRAAARPGAPWPRSPRPSRWTRRRPAPRSITGPRRGEGVLDADLRAGRTEAIEHGFLVERDGTVGFRHELDRHGRGAGPAADRPDAPSRRARGGPAGPPPRPRGTWLGGARSARGPRGGAIEAARLRGAAATPPPTSWPRSSWPCRSATSPAPAAPPRRRRTTSALGPRRPPGPRLGGRLRDRADVAGDRLSRGRDRRASTPGATGSGSGSSTSVSARVRRAAGDAVGAMDGGAARRRARPARRESRTGHGPRLARADLRCSTGIFSDAQRLARDAIKVARACDPAARSRRSTRTTTLAVALAWGSDPNAAIELLREAETAARELDDPDALFRVRRQPDDGPRPGRAADRGRRASPSTGSRTPDGPVSRPSTATSLPATSPTRCSSSAAGRRRAAERRAMALAAGRRSSTRRPSSSWRSSRSRPTPARSASRLLGQTVLEFDARPRAAAGRRRTTSRRRRSRCGAATSPTPAGRSIAAGPSSAPPRSGCSSLGWPRWSPRSMPPPPPRPASTASSRRWPPPGNGRPRCSAGDRAGSRPPVRPPSPARVASPRPTSRRPARIQRRLEGDDDPAVWGKVADDVGPRSTRPTTWRSRAGARPRRCCLGRRRSGRAAPARRCWRRSSWPSARREAAPPRARELAGRARIVLPARSPRSLGRGRAEAVVPVAGRRPGPMAGSGSDNGHSDARPGDRGRSAGRGPPDGHVRAERARARGAGARRPGPDQPRDRGAPVHQPEDGRRPRREHPGQAGGVGPRRGGGGRDPAGPDRAPLRRRRVRPRASSDPGHHETRREVSGFRGSYRGSPRRMGSGRAANDAGKIRSVPLEPGGEGQRDRDERSDGDGEPPGAVDEMLDHRGQAPMLGLCSVFA